MQKKHKAVWFAMNPATKGLRDALKARLGVGNDTLFALAVEALIRAEGLDAPQTAKPHCCRRAESSRSGAVPAGD